MEPQNIGVLTQKQFKILTLRAKGLTQREVARQLKTTRANVSMIEFRARHKLENAKRTISVYNSMQEGFHVTIPKGAELANVPDIIKKNCLKRHMELRSKPASIIRLVTTIWPDYVSDGRLKRGLTVNVDGNGNLTRNISSPISGKE